MMQKKIGIVTVLYNSETVLKDFFTSLAKQTYKNFVLYVVDNTSLDNSLFVAKQLAESVGFKTIFIECNKNFGVAKGNNIGIERALSDNCELVLLSNNDTVLFEDSIKILADNMDKEKADIVTPKIYAHNTDILWYAGGEFGYRNVTLHYGYGKKDVQQFDEIKQVKYAPTCFMLIDKSVFQKVGMMDEKYFVYYDDSDFIFRCNKANIKLLYIPLAKIIHKESTSTGGEKSNFSIYYRHRNVIYFSLKNFNFFQNIIIFGFYTLHLFLRKPLLYNSKQWKIVLGAHIDGIKLYFSK